jgi:hypothetical protein
MIPAWLPKKQVSKNPYYLKLSHPKDAWAAAHASLSALLAVWNMLTKNPAW